MQDHGFVGKVNKWLREAKCQWPQTCSKTPNENKCLHLDMPSAFPDINTVRIPSTKSKSGRNRGIRKQAGCLNKNNKMALAATPLNTWNQNENPVKR